MLSDEQTAKMVARVLLTQFLTPQPSEDLIDCYASQIRGSGGLDAFASGLAEATRIRAGAGSPEGVAAAGPYQEAIDQFQQRADNAERQVEEARVGLAMAEKAKAIAEQSIDECMRDIAADMDITGATEPQLVGGFPVGFPGRGRRLARKASILRDTGRCLESAELYLRAYKDLPHRPDLLAQAGNMLKDAGDFPGAERLYLQAITRLGSTAAPCLKILAAMYENWGRPRRAQVALQRAASLPE